MTLQLPKSQVSTRPPHKGDWKIIYRVLLGDKMIGLQLPGHLIFIPTWKRKVTSAHVLKDTDTLDLPLPSYPGCGFLNQPSSPTGILGVP